MMKKLTNVHLQLKSAFQKGDGKKRKRLFLMKAMQGQSLLQSMKLTDIGEEKKLAVTATARNLNKKVETFVHIGKTEPPCAYRRHQNHTETNFILER